MDSIHRKSNHWNFFPPTKIESDQTILPIDLKMSIARMNLIRSLQIYLLSLSIIFLISPLRVFSQQYLPQPPQYPADIIGNLDSIKEINNDLIIPEP